MENSVNEVQQSFHSPPRRRRSTFFEKRNSILPQPCTTDPDVCNKPNEVDVKHEQILKRYHDILLSEKNQWKAEVNSRRNKYKDMRQQFKMVTEASSIPRISYFLLSDEDIKYSNGKIHISKLIKSQPELHENVKLTKELYRRTTELDNIVMNYCWEKLNDMTDYILRNSAFDLNE